MYRSSRCPKKQLASCGCNVWLAGRVFFFQLFRLCHFCNCLRRVANEAVKQVFLHGSHQVLEFLFLNHIVVYLSEYFLHFLEKHSYRLIMVLRTGLEHGFSLFFSVGMWECRFQSFFKDVPSRQGSLLVFIPSAGGVSER